MTMVGIAKYQASNNDIYEKLVKKRPYLWWWVKDKEKLSVESIVEGVLSYGDMDDVVKLFELLGRNQVERVFRNQIMNDPAASHGVSKND